MSQTGKAVPNGQYSYDPNNLTLFDDKGRFNVFTSDKRNDAYQAELDRQFQRNERLASQEFELDMWNRTNEYNSPVEQLKRYKEAGINPNAMNGSQPVAATPLTSHPSSGRATAPSHGISDIASLMSSSGNFINSLSQAHSTNVKTKWDKRTFEDRALQVAETTKEIESRYHLNNAQTEQVSELNNWISRKSRAELDLMLAELNNEKQTLQLLKAQTDTEKERKELIDAQTFTEISRDGLLEEQISGQQTANERSLLAKKQEELKANFSKITGIPYDADEFKLAYYLWQQDKFEDYIYFTLSKGATDNGSGILRDVMEFFGKVKNYKNQSSTGKRTVTETHGPKGSTYSTSTTMPI